MLEFEIKKRKMNIGPMKGEEMYYASPKVVPRVTSKQLEEEIVRATSLSRGDVRNALSSLAETVTAALQRGASVDLSDLGTLKLSVGAKMFKSPKLINVETGLKTPKIQFFPKDAMLKAAKEVKLKIVR